MIKKHCFYRLHESVWTTTNCILKKPAKIVHVFILFALILFVGCNKVEDTQFLNGFAIGYLTTPTTPTQIQTGITLEKSNVIPFSENGGSSSLTVMLNSRPNGNVVIDVASGDTTEAIITSGSTLIFTPDDWNTQQMVSVTGVDDEIVDGNQTFNIMLTINSGATTDTTGYNILVIPPVTVTVIDDDAAGVTIDTATVSPFSENGGSTTFTVVLNSKPDGDVVIDLVSGDPSEAAVSPLTLTFTTDDWDSPQMVTVSGVDDEVYDGNQTVNINMTVGGATTDTTGYNILVIPPVTGTVTDDDAPPGIITDMSAATPFSENGGSTSFTVMLNSKPNGQVAIHVLSGDPDRVAIDSPSTLYFNAGNWDTPQTVTVSGIDNNMAEGDRDIDIVLFVYAAHSHDTTGYKSLPVSPVPVTVTDDDTADLSIEITGVTGDGSYAVVDFTVTNHGTGAVRLETSGLYMLVWADSTAIPGVNGGGGRFVLRWGTIAGGGGTYSGTVTYQSNITSGTAYMSVDAFEFLDETDETNNVSPGYPWSGGSPDYYVIETRRTVNTDTADTMIWLQDSIGNSIPDCANDSNWLVDDDSGTDSGYSRLVCPVSVLTSGTYYIGVTDHYLLDDPGAYSISIRNSSAESTCPASTGDPGGGAVADPWEDADDTKDGATILDLGCSNAQDHTIELEDRDVFKFTIP